MAAARTEGPAMPRNFTVTQLSLLIKRVLGDNLPGTIHLVGQISNCCRHGSGHLYLTLKDDRSQINAVMWRSDAARLKFTPADGMEVIATGHVDVYEARGQYQFYISRLEPRGVGALELAFRELREKLEKQGLFDRRHKKPIPRFPRCIAIVTSPTGAAIRDILHTLERRCRCVNVLLHPVRVQGEGAAQEIADAIRRINAQAERLGGIDTLIVARGGGSLEDLWAFNEEVVARAIFESRIPVISGVGHEIDVTICDLVADLRAPTPTAAAELAVPVLDELLAMLDQQAARLTRAVRHRLDLNRSRLAAVERFELFRDPISVLRRHEQYLDEVTSRLRLTCVNRLSAARARLHQVEVRTASARPRMLARQAETLERLAHRARFALLERLRRAERTLDAAGQRLLGVAPRHQLAIARGRLEPLADRLDRALQVRLATARQVLDGHAARLEATSYRSTLARGFSITRTRRGRIITSPDQVRPGDRVITETAGGSFESRVADANQGELFD